MKRDPEPITRSSRMIEAVSVGDRYSLAGSHGQAAAYPKHVHARACVTRRWRVRSNNARRNTRLYDNEAASPKLMPVYYEARRSKSIETHSTGCLPARYDFREWKFKSSRGVHYHHPNRGARQFSPSLITPRTLGIWVKFDRCPVSAIRWFIEHRPSETRELARLWCIVGVSISRLRCSHIFFSSHFSFISRFNNEVVVSLYPRGLIYGGTSERVVKVLTGRYGRK